MVNCGQLTLAWASVVMEFRVEGERHPTFVENRIEQFLERDLAVGHPFLQLVCHCPYHLASPLPVSL